VTVLVANLITLFAVALAVGVTYLVRRCAPPGGFPAKDSRSAAVFGVLGTSLAVLLAFVLFLSFQSYVSAKQAASVEALSAHEMYRGASLFDAAAEEDLRGELICYARSVIVDEWQTVQDHRRARASSDGSP
jgi:hypothetical protein